MHNEHESFVLILLSIHIDLFKYPSFLLAHWVYTVGIARTSKEIKRALRGDLLFLRCAHMVGSQDGVFLSCNFAVFEMNAFAFETPSQVSKGKCAFVYLDI